MTNINNTNIVNESALASSMRADGSMSASQSIIGSSPDVTSIVVVCEKNGSPISARHFNIKKGDKQKMSLGADLLASMPDRIIFDIKVTSSTPVNESGFGGSFTLGDPPILFDVPPNSPLTALEMMGMVGANQSRGIVTITLSPIWRRGYFPFTMSINLVDPTTPGRISVKESNILEIYTDPRAGNFFDSLDVEVRQQDSNKILSVIENRREEIQEITRTESSDPGICGKPCVHHTAALSQNRNEKGDITDVDLTLKSAVNLPPSYAGFIVEDGLYGEPFVSAHSYRGNTFRQVSNISMSMYNFNNKNYAYDQLVTKRLLCVGTNENRPHPLVDVSDPFSCIDAFPDSNIPLFEFRTDHYSSNYFYSKRNPYLFYINAAGIRSSNKIVRAIDFSSNTSSVPVKLTIQMLSEKNASIKRMNDVGIIFTTTIGIDSSARSFTNFIRIRTRSSDDKYGYHKTYGSGKSLPDQGWPHYDVTIGDFYELISQNISGNIDGSLPEKIDVLSKTGYKGGQSCAGLFPTFSECGIPSPSPNDPIISVQPGSNLSACYGLPAHRMWLGNTDDSVFEAITESQSVSMTTLQGSPFVSLFCRGPEKSFSLENFTLAMPLARGASRAFLRSSIKEYAEHAADGDFDNLRANRFYPLRTIADAVDFIRFGTDYIVSKLEIKPSYSAFMNPSGLAIGKRNYGENRPCIGASNVGISINFAHESKFHPHRFYQEVGSYFLSAISQTEPYRMGPSSMVVNAASLSRNKDGATYLCYCPGEMFTSPRAGLSVSADNDIATQARITTGGEWHVLYSTLIDDYLGGVKYKDYGIVGYAALDPFIHDSNASLKSEGGLPGSSKRKVYINPCIDFGGFAVKPSYDHVGYDLDDFCTSTGRYAGNVQRFVKSESPGSIGIPISGSIIGDLSIRSSYPFDDFNTYVNSNLYKNYFNTFGNMLESLNDSFGWSISSSPTSALAREDKVPFDLIRVELIDRQLPPVEPVGPEPYSPYFPYSDYLQPYFSYDKIANKLYSNSITPVMPKIFEPYYSYSTNTNNPYEPYNIYEPYVTPSYYNNASILLRSSRPDKTVCDLGKIVSISISKIMKDVRYFDFNLSDRKNRTIANLIRSFEDRMGAFGVHARSAVSNPNSYISERMVPKSRENILETEISTISEIEIITTDVETPISAPREYDYKMNLFRHLDSDIYGYVIQRCDDLNSIDDRYPFFPYVFSGGLYNCGDFLQNIYLMQDVSQWGQNYAGKIFMGGAMGKKPDVQGKTYGLEGSPEREFAYNVSSLAQASTSLYDTGDTARRSSVSGVAEKSEVNKYQWFDFESNSVKGSNRYSIAAGYGGSTFITRESRKLDTPRTGYTSTPGEASAIYDLIISNPGIWDLEKINPELIDDSNAFNIVFSFGSCANGECVNQSQSQLDKVSAGNGITLAIRKNGSIAYYGPGVNNSSIAAVPAGNDFVDITIGGTFFNPFGLTCKSDGSAVIWGTPANDNLIYDFYSIIGSNFITQVASGINHAVALTDDGTVICWGDDSFNQCQVPSGMGIVTQIAAAQYYTMALNEDGDVYVWGNGVPGDDIYLGVENIPAVVSNHVGFEVTKISAGESFAMALGSNGHVYCWGLNDFGQCDVPSNIQGYVVDIDAGANHALTITKNDNFIASWGSNEAGQLNISSSIYDAPSQTPYAISAGHDYSVIITQGGKTAPIRGLFSNDLDADGIDDPNSNNNIRLISIDQSVDSVCVTLDTFGTVRIINTADQTPMGGGSFGQSWDQIIYFDDQWIADGFLTDDTGEPVFIENKDFVSVCASSGLLGMPEYVWCLHKNGKLYGVELLSARSRKYHKNKVGIYWGKRNKFNNSDDSGSGRSANFGKAIGILTINGYEYSDYSIGATQFSNLSDSYGKVFSESGEPLDNGYCLDIAHALNFIPKVNGVRFPVISVNGGYHTGGIALCVDPVYDGYSPTDEDNFNHPVQMCEVVKLQNLTTASSNLINTLQRIQRYKANYNSSLNTWSYVKNEFGQNKFDQELYDSIFGIIINNGGTNYISYVPPRCVSYARGAGLGTSGLVSIMGNNGNFAILAGSGVVVPAYFSAILNSNYYSEFNDGKINMTGDFEATQEKFAYDLLGRSVIFNSGTASYSNFVNYKFNKNPEGEEQAGMTTVTLSNFDADTVFSPAWKQAVLGYGWGNPPFQSSDEIYTDIYGIKVNGSANNIYGFSYYDNFGNLENDLPSYMMKEVNYIDNSHIVKVIAYPDENGNLPIHENGEVNSNYLFANGCVWNVLSICDHEKMVNPFVWIKSVGDGIFGIRMDGSIDIVGNRNSDLDDFVFDPFWDSPWPVGRLNQYGVEYSQLRPANYKTRTEEMRKLGSYYELDPYAAPFARFKKSSLYNNDPYVNPYLNPYIINHVQSYISKPKPVFNVYNGTSTLNVLVDVLDPSFSGAFALDFDFNVSRRASASNAAPDNRGNSDQRPRNDPAVRSLMTGEASPGSVAQSVSENSVNASYAPYETAGEETSADRYNQKQKQLQAEYEEKMRRQS